MQIISPLIPILSLLEITTRKRHRFRIMIRLGLCCLFRNEPIRFRTTTVTAMLRLKPAARRQHLAGLCMANARALHAALEYAATHGIGAFRVNSRILPVKTHPATRYEVEDLPDGKAIAAEFRRCGAFARAHNLRTLFHPDQFILLNSPNNLIVQQSVEEIEYQSVVCDWIGADVINLHGGGVYSDKKSALARLRKNLDLLSDKARRRLTLENDDRLYTPADLLPLCRTEGIPLVYDVHHHRCLPDGLSVDEATRRARATWDREPVFHLSSPIRGWKGPAPMHHHDFIDPCDFPACWQRLNITVEVEAKAKELAIQRLRRWMKSKAISVWEPG